MIAEIIPEIKTRGEGETFSYSILKEMEGDIKVGSIVNVQFGKQNIRGVAKEILNPKSEILNNSQIKNQKYKLKYIKSFNSIFSIPYSYIDIAKWISQYYFCSLGEAIELFLPPAIKNPRSQDTITPSTSLGAGKKQDTNKFQIKNLNSEQEKIFIDLKKSLFSKTKKPALIYGVTGSGKTEIYIKLAQEVLKQGKQVVVLVPEIVLTPQTVERFEEVFADQICLMHSKMSMSQKYHCYDDFYHGRKKIIIGPRSALLVPSQNIGLIIIDEEQEESYKQEQNPKYHAVDLAEKIAETNNALLILGSATPRVETFYKTETDKFDCYEIKSRYRQLILPPAEVVDLREELKAENYSPISRRLAELISQTLKAKRQSLLFINRRGSSTFVSCRDCAEVINCPKCDIPLIHHIGGNSGLRCHHCDYKVAVPNVCPNCQSIRIKYFGAGVEKIESEIRELFPKAKIMRVDADTMSSESAYKKFYSDFKNHKIDIAIGTQILAKGLDIPGVDLVGIVSADVGLHLPYFRASEKTFRILTQVSGRSGRRDNVGKTLIQTYWPNSRAIIAASKHDYKLFYDEEIKNRKDLNYPPFSQIIRVVSEDKNAIKAKDQLILLSKNLERKNIEYIGPGLCFFQRIRDKWRYHIIIKSHLTSHISQNLRSIYLKHQNLNWDVDAYDML